MSDRTFGSGDDIYEVVELYARLMESPQEARRIASGGSAYVLARLHEDVAGIGSVEDLLDYRQRLFERVSDGKSHPTDYVETLRERVDVLSRQLEEAHGARDAVASELEKVLSPVAYAAVMAAFDAAYGSRKVVGNSE